MPAALVHPSTGLMKPSAGSQIDWSNPITRGLVGAWVFNERSGMLVNEVTGLSASGQFTGGAAWSNDAVQFNGSTGYLALGNPPSLDLPLSWTIVAEVNHLNFTGLQNIFFRGDGAAAQYGFVYYLGDGRWSVQSGADLDMLFPLTIGRWATIGGTHTGSVVTAYGNGQITNTGASSIPAKTNAPTIGADIVNGRYFNGLIRRFYIWNRVLTPSEMATDYAEPYAMLRGPDRWRGYDAQLLSVTTGVGAGSFTALVGAATGTQTQSGTAAGAFTALVGAAVGTQKQTGVGAGAFAALLGAAVGTQTQAGTAAGAFTALVGSASGTQTQTGTGAGAFTALVGAATGVHGTDPSGAGAGTFAAIVGAATGVQTITGTGAGAFTALVGEAVGAQTQSGTGAGTFTALVGAASGAQTFTGAGAGTFTALVGAASGTQAGTFTGTGAGVFGALIGAATGTITVNVIDLVGVYQPVMVLVGLYSPAMALAGRYEPTMILGA